MFEDIEFPEKRYVIKFKDGVTAQQRSTLISKCKHRRASKVGYRKRKNPTDRHTHFYGNINDNEMDRLLDSKHVEYVEEAKHGFLLSSPDDTMYNKQWAYNKNIQVWHQDVKGHVDAEIGWDYFTGSSDIVVAVCDTGVDYMHPDLNENMWKDGNGNYGWTFTPDLTAPNGDPATFTYQGVTYTEDHGTHVAGIIGAVGNNSRGVTGLAQKCKIIPINVFYGLVYKGEVIFTLDTPDVADAIYYAVDNGAKVINHSWGGQFDPPMHLLAAWTYALNAGCICVCASGNSSKNNDYYNFNPANINSPNNITVNSNNFLAGHSSFSNYGITNTNIYAPGGETRAYDSEDNILSTITNDRYTYYPGTSMAAPVVTSFLGLLGHRIPGATVGKLRDTLHRTIMPFPDMFLSCYSGGMVNYGRAMKATRSGHGVNLYSVSDARVSVDYAIPYPHSIEWSNPPGIFRIIISRKPWCYPQKDYGNETNELAFDNYIKGMIVDEDVEIIYNGDSDDPIIDIESDPYAIYGYKIETWYKFGANDFRQALPVYLRSYPSVMPFSCPREPAYAFEFLCDWWDEAWVGVRGQAMKDPVILAQLWRAITSKNITARRDVIPSEPFSYRPGSVFKHYFPLEGVERFSMLPWERVPVHPVAEHVNTQEGISAGAIFIQSLTDNIKRHMLGFDMYSNKYKKRMIYRWMDYYQYINTGRIGAYKPPDKFYKWNDAYIKDQDNWEEIIKTAQEIINSMHVLYTGLPSYGVLFKVFHKETCTSIPGSVGGITHSTVNFSVPVNSQMVDEGPDVPNKPDGEYIYTGGAFDRLLASMNPYTVEKVWSTIQPVGPIENMSKFDIGFKFCKLPSVGWANWNTPTTTHIDYTDYYVDNHIVASYFGYETEPPGNESANDVTWGREFGTYGLCEGLLEQVWDYPVKREIFYGNGAILCSEYWDWEMHPVRFDVYHYLRARAGVAPSQMEWTFDRDKPINHFNAAEEFGPYDRDVGTIPFTLKLPESLGGRTIQYRISPAKEFRRGPSLEHLGYWIQDSNEISKRVHDFEYSFNLNSINASMPSHCKHAININEATIYRNWWTSAYKYNMNTGKTTGPDVTVTPEEIKIKDAYTFVTYQFFFSGVVVVATTPFEAPLACQYIPDLRGADITDKGNEDEHGLKQPHTDEVERMCNQIDFKFPDLNIANNETLLVNTHEHYVAPGRFINQLPLQGAVKAHVYNNPNKGISDEFCLSVCVANGTEKENKYPDYRIPCVEGMTLQQAKEYLQAQYPDWSIIEGTYVSEVIDLPSGGQATGNVFHSLIYRQLCNYTQPGTICAQMPDWRQRHRPIFPAQRYKLRVCINDELTDGMAMMNNLVGHYYGDDICNAEEERLLNLENPVSLVARLYWNGKRGKANLIVDQMIPDKRIIPTGQTRQVILYGTDSLPRLADYPVPNLVGLSLKEALNICSGKFTIRSNNQMYSDYPIWTTMPWETPDATDRYIVAQSPKPHHKYATYPANGIDVVLSAGPLRCREQLRVEKSL